MSMTFPRVIYTYILSLTEISAKVTNVLEILAPVMQGNHDARGGLAHLFRHTYNSYSASICKSLYKRHKVYTFCILNNKY